MERDIPNFDEQYQIFQNNIENLDIRLINEQNPAFRNRLQEIQSELATLDVKMRLAFGIREIRLNNDFVSDKQDDLKRCHLLYYKLADLWFAYDTYLKFYTKIVGSQKNSVDWIDANVHNNYSTRAEITLARNTTTLSFNDYYSNEARRNLFLDYLAYCKTTASNSQRRRLDQIIIKIQNQNFVLTNSEIMAITYAVRNNFVHNGETTVVPDNFGYRNKSQLLSALYSYLAIVLLISSNITFERI